MKIREFFRLVKNNFDYKTVFMAVFSLAINLSFIAYNLYLGIFYNDAFAIGISIYYLLLTWVITSTLIAEKRVAGKENSVKIKTRIKNYKISSFFMFVIDFCLIAPIILMAVQPKDVKFGLIPAIAMAVFCLYKIIVAIINYFKSKKSQNPTTILLKEINFIGAIVSILSLQHTLIMVNGGMNESMKILSLVTSIGFLVLIMIFSVITFIKNKKLLENSYKNAQNDVQGG